MFGKLIGDTLGLVGDTVRVVTAPVAVGVAVTRAATKPIADAVEEVAKDTQAALTDDTAPK